MNETATGMCPRCKKRENCHLAGNFEVKKCRDFVMDPAVVQVEHILHGMQQQVSYDLTRMLASYRPAMMPIVIATIQICINTYLPRMTKEEREVYDRLLESTTAIVLSADIDPRRL